METDDDSYSVSPLLKSWVKLFTPLMAAINPFQTLQYPSCFLLFFFVLVTSTVSSSSNFEILYADHCNHVVPTSPITVPSTSIGQILAFDVGYFTGGDSIFGHNYQQSAVNSPRSVSFHPIRKYLTESEGVYKLQASLRFQLPFFLFGNSTNRRLRDIRFRGPRIPVQRGSVVFQLNGYWSESSGNLCMVGSGSNVGKFQTLNFVLKLNYPRNSGILGSLVSGILESLDVEGTLNYFKPISVLGVRQYDKNDEYRMVEKGNESVCLGGYDDAGESLSPDSVFRDGVCSVFRRFDTKFELIYGSDCDNITCNPFGKGVEYLPKFVVLSLIRCSEKHKMQMLLEFTNSIYNGYRVAFDPNTTLLAEGKWDEKKKRLCAIGCRILNITESLANTSVLDCSTKLSLRFPAVLSLSSRSIVEGYIWSNRTMIDSAFFGKILFRGSDDALLDSFPGLKYEYTKISKIGEYCAGKQNDKRRGKTYPNGHSSDMRFHMSVKNSGGQKTMGYSSPLFVGNHLYGQHFFDPMVRERGSAVQVKNNSSSSLLNISYKLSLSPPPHFKVSSKIFLNASVEISAEGTYDTETGILCMIGCWDLGSQTEKLMRNGSVDCEIVVNVQFRPLSKGGGNIKGTIKSMRERLDPLHFDSLELSSNSIYARQAKESIWRMDMEITMVLVSNTLACVFVGMQLLYVKKHPEVLPLISFDMLILITLGHMIPLLLNFEAFFVTNHNRQNVFLGSGGWLEVNEVIVRVVTMVAFLLEFRLLQLTWSARQDDGSQKGLWVSELKVLYVCLPLYILGAMIAWLVHKWKNSNIPKIHLGHAIPSYQRNSIWADLRSYAGLILDSFLLPQIMFNLFFNSNEKALALSFYIGTTFVRLLPHAYDLYRSHTAAWYVDLSYIYANHKWELFSTFWDIIIPFVGLLLAILIYLQQKFGAPCILPRRLRENSVYEKVPTVNSEESQELQMEAIR